MRRVHLVIRGLVQGVSYRASTASVARGLGLTGWVRNEHDGAVVAEAQGAPARVDDLIEWCKHGPPHARVEGVEVLEAHTVAGEQGFAIRH